MTSRADGPENGITVPLLDLKRQYEPLRESIERRIRAVCDGQQFILGPEVENLEARIADYCRTDFAIGVSSGTDALLVALMAMGIGPEDAVITPAYSFFATAGVIARLGARPVFCDVDPVTFNLDPEAVAGVLRTACRREGKRIVHRASGRTVRAILPVHLYGQMADMDALSVLATDDGLSIVEDAAQAIGAGLPDGRRAGGIGDVGCLSFFPSKNLGAFGDAGMCVTRSAELAGRMRGLRVHGETSAHRHAFVGGNFRLDALQAAVLDVKLDYLDAWTAARRKNALSYNARLTELKLPVRVPVPKPGFGHVFNQYVIEADRRDALRRFLRERGVGTAIYYPVPLHLQECFRDLGYEPGDCPVAEHLAERSLALPVYPELTAEEQQHVLDCIASFFGGQVG